MGAAVRLAVGMLQSTACPVAEGPAEFDVAVVDSVNCWLASTYGLYAVGIIVP